LVSKNSTGKGLGFFQIGGGIAEIFQYVWFQCCTKIWKCMMYHLELFCQISEILQTSYGSYSGAVPNEKLLGEN
jgi:deoxyhypusine synthase